MKVWSSQLWLRFKQLQLSLKNVFGGSTGFEPMAFALALQCSTNWALTPVEAPKTFFGLNCDCLKSQWQPRWSHLYFICMSAVHIPVMFICFIRFTGTMNSTNWPAPNVWVFIAQLVEHYSANAEAMGSNLVEAPKKFFRLNCDCLNCNHNCDDRTFISFVCPQFT